ncbi:ADP-ribosylglycohydrolase [uncultured archaeon]|nr:ADP-ribosylglycohydrolase [uncultured archaeon]
MLLEIAIGDAYGAGFEYVPREIIEKFNDLSSYRKHQKYDIGNGRYTDDTQMSIGIAELLLENKEWTQLNIANKFVEVFKRDEREGYAGAFYLFLKEIKSGKEFLEKIKPNSDKNGGAMRAPPLGFLPDIGQLIDYVKFQGSITHNTSGGMDAAVAAALMSHYFIYDLGEKKNLGKFISNYVPGNWNLPWKGEVGAKGFMAVMAGITAIQKEDSLSKVLETCVNFGGDVDTVAAIAMGAASCSKEIKNDLPETLIKGLENNNFGRDYLINLDKKLKTKFKI